MYQFHIITKDLGAVESFDLLLILDAPATNDNWHRSSQITQPVFNCWIGNKTYVFLVH
jgi:hypothetical protein